MMATKKLSPTAIRILEIMGAKSERGFKPFGAWFITLGRGNRSAFKGLDTKKLIERREDGYWILTPAGRAEYERLFPAAPVSEPADDEPVFLENVTFRQITPDRLRQLLNAKKPDKTPAPPATSAFKVGDVVTDGHARMIVTAVKSRKLFGGQFNHVWAKIEGAELPRMFHEDVLTSYAGSDLEWAREGKAMYAAALKRIEELEREIARLTSEKQGS